MKQGSCAFIPARIFGFVKQVKRINNRQFCGNFKAVGRPEFPQSCFFIWSNSSAFHCPAKALCASDTRLAQTETGSIDHTTLHMQRDSAICGRQAAENAACVHIFCNGEQEGRAVTKKRPNRRKYRKKMLSELRPELSVTKGIIKSIFHLQSTFLYYILSLYLFRAMLGCPCGSLFKGFRIYSFYGI